MCIVVCAGGVGERSGWGGGLVGCLCPRLQSTITTCTVYMHPYKYRAEWGEDCGGISAELICVASCRAAASVATFDAAAALPSPPHAACGLYHRRRRRRCRSRTRPYAPGHIYITHTHVCIHACTRRRGHRHRRRRHRRRHRCRCRRRLLHHRHCRHPRDRRCLQPCSLWWPRVHTRLHHPQM